MRVIQNINKIWEPLFLKEGRYYLLFGGRGAGRSTVAAQFLLTNLLGKPFFRCAVMRAVHSDIRNSIWREFVDKVNESKITETLKIADSEMYAEYGQNMIHAHGFRASSGSLTARLKSLANYNCVVIEEAEEIGEDEFRTLDDTLRTIKGTIRVILVFNTPAKSHWIMKKWFDMEPSTIQGFYLPKLKSDCKDVVVIYNNFLVNAINLDPHTIERYKEYQRLNPSYYWQVIEGLSPEEARGKIYTGWQIIDAIPQDARLVKFGVDWGWYPDPLAIVALYYYNGSYIVDEVIYGTNISDEMAANTIKGVNGWRTIAAVCGADEPKSIEVMKKYGILAEKTAIGPGSVEYRIKATSAKKIFVTKRSKNVWTSYENYAWAEDKDGNPKSEPNHYLSDCMDASSYAIASINPLQEYVIPRPQPHKERVNKGL